jgi:hypothetical protein
MPGQTGQGGYGFPPQQSYPTPPPKKSGALKWVLIGCGGFTMLGVIAVMLFVWWGWNKAKQAGLDPELLRKNPTLAVAKMAVASNPDVEVVSVDDARGTMVIKDKKTGKRLTLDMTEAREGTIVFRGEDGEEMRFNAQGAAERGTVEVKTKEGTATFSAGTQLDLPSWLPEYPGATIEGNFSARSEKGEGGSFGFVTSDSVDEVIRFYDDKLKDAGMRLTAGPTLSVPGAAKVSMITAEDKENRRSVVIQATSAEGKTRVTVTFGSK